MDEYIKRKDVLSYIYALHSQGGFKCEEDYLWLHDRVINAPSADVQPVKLGKWECEHYDELIECYEANCSECGYESTDNYRITPNHRYCEYCGTRMIKDGVFE